MQRIITAVILLPFLIASILIPWLKLLFVTLVAAAMVFALYEFWLLARRQQVKADVAAGYLGAAALLTMFYFADPRAGLDFEMMQAIILVFTMGALASAMLRGGGPQSSFGQAGIAPQV